MLIKEKSPSLPRNLALGTFGELLIVSIPRLFNNLIKENCAENFSQNSNLDDSGISLLVFPSRTNLKLHNIPVTTRMVKKVIINLDLSKASAPVCITLVVLKNCEPELSNILAEPFSK